MRRRSRWMHIVVIKAITDYQMGLRAAAYGLWSGQLDIDEARAAMFSTIERRLPEAWEQGSKGCGVSLEELTAEEALALGRAIADEKSFAPEFLEWVEQNSRANGGKRATIFSRLDTWINRYRDLTNRAKAMACADMKAEWTLGPTEHCPTCAKLAGKVKRMSYWQAHVMPQQPPNPNLECGGWNCQCVLVETDAPLSRGPLPRVP